MTDRNQGNPNTRPTDREAGRMGRDRNAADIPAQAGLDTNTPLALLRTVATYRVGPPVRPHIRHDDGFLALGRRTPDAAAYLKLAQWKAMLEGAEALRPDLTDALGAYRHFLEGKGADRELDYERFVINDSSGRIILQNAIVDAEAAVVQIWLSDPGLVAFEFTGTAIPCGGAGDGRFPYPATENWQKAIGAHYIWMSGNATVTAESGRGPTGSAAPRFSLSLTVRVEDRYNFNPGAADIVTGIPDSDNGLFEMTGLAHQYTHYGDLRRSVQWQGTGIHLPPGALSASGRHRQPTGNRRLRNRL